MSDIRFTCPHCEQSLEAEADMAGDTIDCPSCGGQLRIPAPSRPKKLALQPRPTARPTQTREANRQSLHSTQAQQPPTLRFSRDKEYYGRIRKLKVLVDSRQVAGLKCGQTAEVRVTPGAHLITVSMDWEKSPAFSVECGPGDILSFTVGSFYVREAGSVRGDSSQHTSPPSFAPAPQPQGYGDSGVPDRIRQSLSQSNQHKVVLCLDCGYSGMMAVIKGSEKVPWYLSWPFLIILILSGIGFIPALILGFLRGACTKVQVVCPNCNHILGPV